jgi:hypothetical protein
MQWQIDVGFAIWFVSGHRFSDANKSSESNAPLGAGRQTP